MTRLAPFALGLCCFVLLSHQAMAQRGMGDGVNTVSVTGTVFSDSHNQRVSQAEIRLCDSGGNRVAETIANDSGEFFFRGISRNTYILSVSANGFQSQDVHLDLSFGSDRGMSVFLKPLPGNSPAPASASSVSTHEMAMPQKARDLLASGEKKIYQDKNPQGGLQDLQRAIAIAPGYYEAYYQTAMAYVSLGNSGEAERAFRQSIEISSDKYGEAAVGLGALLVNKGSSIEGEKDIRHGIELNPNFWLGYYELGRVLLNQKNFAEAGKAGEQARSLAPASPIVYRLLSNVHLNERNYAALLQDLDAYIKLDPDSPAGLRAKELRTQVAQKVGEANPIAAGGPATK
ncbi:MAG: carboxypeptidase regulatory-like domain-containing protein [Candidatus Acidiferrales bacterium]|jgi:Tfp pilus assembly protein PilF